MQHFFCGGICVKRWSFFDYLCISNPTGTNKPNFSCLLCKIVGKDVFCLFFRHVLCLTLEFFFVVFTIYLTRLISLSIFLIFYENIATYTIWGIAGLELPMKVVVSCDKLGVGADILWSQDCLMGLPKQFTVWSVEDWEPTELKHLSRWRKRKQ